MPTTTRQGAAAAADAQPALEMAAYATRLAEVEDVVERLEAKLANLTKDLEELKARPTVSPVEAFAGAKNGDLLKGSSALFHRLCSAESDEDPLSTSDQAVRAMHIFEPSARFREALNKPLSAQGIEIVLLELEAWASAHEDKLPFHLKRFLSPWGHALTQLSEMPIPSLPLATSANYVSVDPHYLLYLLTFEDLDENRLQRENC